MIKQLRWELLALSGSLLMLTGIVRAGPGAVLYLAETSVLENTGQNVRDESNITLTPEDQKESKSDLRITTHIRKMLVKSKSLSVDAQNAKIITRNGVVTLRGPVKNAAESMKLQKIAKKTRGVKQVDNQLEHIAP